MRGSRRASQVDALLVARGRVEAEPLADAVPEPLPLFRRVFQMDRNWVTLTPRLPKSGLLPDDSKIIGRILAVGK